MSNKSIKSTLFRSDFFECNLYEEKIRTENISEPRNTAQKDSILGNHESLFQSQHKDC